MRIQNFVRQYGTALCLALVFPVALAAGIEPPTAKSPPPKMHAMAGMHEDMPEPVPPFLRGIELTESQRDEVFNIMHEQLPALRKHDKAERKAREALQAMALSAKYDEAKARALAESIGKGAMELTLLRARSEQMIFAVLTPQQRQQLETMKSQRHPGPNERTPALMPPPGQDGANLPPR